MVKTREEIIAQLTAHIGENTSDESIALIEDVTDTLTDFETRLNGDGKDWEAEYHKLDKEWRDKYINRFSTGKDPEDGEETQLEQKNYTYESLFEEKEDK